MKKPLAITLVAIAGIVMSALIFGAGMMVGRVSLGISGINPSNMTLAPAPLASGRNNPGYSMMGGNGYSMMGGYRSSNVANAKPLTVDQAKQAVEGYLKGLNNSDFELKEIMIFNNNAYARITEKSTGIGAMELLVDPVSLSVFPEYGPNMMWNLKYGMTLAPAFRAGVSNTGGGMMGGRRGMTLVPDPRAGAGGYNNNPGSVSATMTVTSEQADKIAQQYLDQQFPGYQAATDPDPFYGYYTIDIMKDGKPTGMLSINGFSGQVFLHTWHGTFIEKSE
jgi:hypothetical protein